MKIDTKYGQIDEQELRKVERRDGDTTIVDYYLGEDLVHRSATAPLRGIQASGSVTPGAA